LKADEEFVRAGHSTAEWRAEGEGYAVSAHLLMEEAHCRAARRGQRGQGLDGSFIPDSKAESNFIILLEKSAQTGNRGEVSGALNRPLQSPVQRPEI
jgi:hypothetical protein